MKLKSTKQFDRAYRKFVRRYSFLKSKIDDTLVQMGTNLADPSLKTHKLGGKLRHLVACSCGYDCRIIFSIEQDKATSEKFIVLIDVGTHDEVY